MIVAIASNEDRSLKSLLAANLAVLRMRSGRKVCVVDTCPRRGAYSWSCERSAAGQGPSVPVRALRGSSLAREIDDLAMGFGDLLINTGDRDTQETRAALAAARLVLVPVQAGQADPDTDYALIARLNAARMFNPGLKVLFVMVSASAPGVSAESEAALAVEQAAVRRYASQVMSASLAATVIHAPCAHDYGQGRCVCDAETCDPDSAAELHALYHEIYVHCLRPIHT